LATEESVASADKGEPLKLVRHPLIWLFLLASIPAICSAQSFIFASPNTREQMSDQDALASLSSFEEKNFVAVSQYLGAQICGNPKVEESEGLDGPGAENSALITGCAPQSAAYLAELLGRYAHQKFVLIFSASANGPERLFILDLPSEQPAQALQQLHQKGFTAATVIAEDQNVRIFIWVQDHSQDENIRALAADNQGRAQELHGKGLLIGSDDRAAAQPIFDKDIAAYERHHQVKLSAQLWSQKLRDLGLQAK
jgi:hypothetical protein